jgi:hypothetical protein
MSVILSAFKISEIRAETRLGEIAIMLIVFFFYYYYYLLLAARLPTAASAFAGDVIFFGTEL